MKTVACLLGCLALLFSFSPSLASRHFQAHHKTKSPPHGHPPRISHAITATITPNDSANYYVNNNSYANDDDTNNHNSNNSNSDNDDDTNNTPTYQPPPPFDCHDCVVLDKRKETLVGQSSKGLRRVAIFLQVGNQALYEELLSCAKNVLLLPQASQVDLFIGTHSVELERMEEMLSMAVELAEETASKVGRGALVVVQKFPNVGEDVGTFFEQIKSVLASEENYDFALKFHTKTDPVWRGRGIESLCGTPSQIESIIHQFEQKPVDMISPLGLLFSATSAASATLPYVFSVQYPHGSPPDAFDPKTVEKLTFLLRLTGALPNDLPPNRENLRIVAGSMYWFRPGGFDFPRIFEGVKQLGGFKPGYALNLRVEHVLERYFGTSVACRGREVLEITPAPKPMAIYFPQYHRSEVNDRLWGENFTEWTLLKPFEGRGVRKPLRVEEGGLGYYDLMDFETRKRQGELARGAGIYGFMYYHYWFDGGIPPEHKVLYAVLEQMLRDNEPNLPFMLSWANEPWTKTWTGKEQDILLPQNYGSPEDWDVHFDYLFQFFSHPNYIKLRGEPLFAIYRTNHIGPLLGPMIARWRQRARERGLPGLKFISTTGGFLSSKDDFSTAVELHQHLHGTFHFWPSLLAWRGLDTPVASRRDVPEFPKANQYWGAFTSFDHTVRRAVGTRMHVSPSWFSSELRHTFYAMSQQVGRDVDVNFFFINAWNEWNEQAVLEPDTSFGFGYLGRLREELKLVPALWRGEVEKVANMGRWGRWGR